MRGLTMDYPLTVGAIARRAESLYGGRPVVSRRADRFPAWWLPDDVIFLPAIPRTSTGKFLKSTLRASLRGHYGGGG